jgi:PAS domain S-box-containing protein
MKQRGPWVNRLAILPIPLLVLAMVALWVADVRVAWASPSVIWLFHYGPVALGIAFIVLCVAVLAAPRKGRAKGIPLEAVEEAWRANEFLAGHYKRTFIALAILFTGACAFLFNIFYKEAKNTAITKLNDEQRIHAKQAARGIEEFFATWTRSLDSLSKMDEIGDTDAVGKRYMKLFYEANQEQIRSITRLDERGVILHNFPISSSVGADISDQKHVRELLRGHKPVISDVFRAVEGFRAVALHVPIIRGSVFKGSIGILIDFESLAKRYLDVIKIGETGNAWVVSRDGTQLYSPITEFTGKSVFETIKDSPSLNVMANEMVQGHEGAAACTLDVVADGNAARVRKYAVYMPIHIGGTFWSIAVASDEKDVLSGLISFRNKLAFFIGAIFLGGIVFSTLGTKAWFHALRQNEAMLRAMLEQMPSGVTVRDAGTGKLIMSNAHAQRLLGPLVATIHEYSAYKALHPDGRPVAGEEWPLARSAATGEVVKGEDFDYQHPGGARITLRISSAPMHDGDGRIVAAVAVFDDVTERRQVEEAIQASEAKYRNLFENMTEEVYFWKVVRDENGQIRTWRLVDANPPTLKSWGKTLDEIRGKTTDEIFGPGAKEHYLPVVRKIMTEGVPIVFEDYFPNLDKYFRFTSVPLGNHFITTGADITGIKKAEETLRQSEAELSRSNKDLEQFAYVASHDLQEPLRMVAGYVDLLRERYQGRLDDKADKYIAYAVDGAQRMSTLIRDLLAYSRVNTRGEELQPIDSKHALDFALRSLTTAVKESGAAITHDPLPIVRADKTQLGQLFQNLIGNAVKFRCPDQPPQIHISVSEDAGHWLFSVRDNGIGFKQEYQDKLFLVFQRLHSRGKYPGTGIGLAICKRIVERHGGRIWAAGEPGQGSTFSFTIPR